MPEIAEPELKKAEPNHVPALDGLRGLAILLVLFRHLGFSEGPDKAWWMRGLADITQSGYIGVDLFFVLSGFLITGILYTTLDQRRYFRNFYMRRFLRIFPLYYGFLLVLFVLSRPLHIAWKGMFPVFLAYLQNVHFAKPYTVVWYYTGQLWSLAVEEQFYIAWPLLIFFIRGRRRLMVVALFLSLLSLLFRITFLMHGASSQLVYRLTPCRMDSLLIGGWLALAMRGPAEMWISRFARPVFLASVLIYICFNFPIAAPPASYVVEAVRYSVIAIGFAALLVMALNASSWTAKFFRLESMRWLGKYSYGIYVIHLAALHVVNGTVGRWHPVDETLYEKIALSWTVSLISAGLSLCLAWISYNFYEVRFLKLKRYFSYAHPPRQPAIAG